MQYFTAAQYYSAMFHYSAFTAVWSLQWNTAVQCFLAVHCNLQLSSQLVNLLLLDWTRSSQQRNIANISPTKIIFLVCFWSTYNVSVRSSTTVWLPDAHISCCNYKMICRQFWRGTPSWSFIFFFFLLFWELIPRTERYYRLQLVKFSREFVFLSCLSYSS